MRFVPPAVLLLMSPFVGEYLLGNIPAEPTSWLAALPLLVLLYGCGALLVREVARRMGRGYPTMALLAVGYGLLEEGVVLGTLFNRDYLGLGLLEYGWIPALGTSPVWTTYVVGIHSVWSILVPIVLVEHLFPKHSHSPWLRTPGLGIVIVLYVLGAAALGFVNFLTYQFLPSPAQLAAVLTLVAVSVAIAVFLRPRQSRRAEPTPAPAVVALIALLLGSAFMAVQYATALPPVGLVAVNLGLAAAAATTLVSFSTRADWSVAHTLGAATGAVLTYCWAGFVVQTGIHGVTATGLTAQAVFALIALGVVLLAWRRAELGATARTSKTD